MARRCELSGKGPMSGHKVSHANNKSKRVFRPNLSEASLVSEALGRTVRLRVTAHALRTVEHRGGFDSFLLQERDANLSVTALDLKRQIKKKAVEAAASAPAA